MESLELLKGKVIEKGGVAFSNVIGKFPKEFAKKIPGTKNNTNFWSSGISVVLHPKILKFLQCILIQGLFVHRKIGLVVVST